MCVTPAVKYPTAAWPEFGRASPSSQLGYFKDERLVLSKNKRIMQNWR